VGGRDAPGGGLYDEMAPLSAAEGGESDAPWWTAFSGDTIGVVVSFVGIIGIMLATANLVFRVGGIHFNE
jgi:hypothetical protein